MRSDRSVRILETASATDAAAVSANSTVRAFMIDIVASAAVVASEAVFGSVSAYRFRLI